MGHDAPPGGHRRPHRHCGPRHPWLLGCASSPRRHHVEKGASHPGSGAHLPLRGQRARALLLGSLQGHPA
eukprot:16449234-Heterocapsa_arctica.AAC.1